MATALNWDKARRTTKVHTRERLAPGVQAITARFDGTCHVCKTRTRKGQKIVWDPVAGVARHAGCTRVQS